MNCIECSFILSSFVHRAQHRSCPMLRFNSAAYLRGTTESGEAARITPTRTCSAHYRERYRTVQRDAASASPKVFALYKFVEIQLKQDSSRYSKDCVQTLIRKLAFSVRMKSTHRRSDFIRAKARISSAVQIYSAVTWISLHLPQAIIVDFRGAKVTPTQSFQSAWV